MYTLTLTHEDRKAIDWVGHRYSNGDDLFDLLWDSIVVGPAIVGKKWDDDIDITFHIPEHIAWQIKENAEQEDGFWPCFADELAIKMQAFCDSIV
tara:strand:- start:376 stop:660 length:285 start_codon:yes stop_codon:yes gene_type:complete